MEIDLWKDITSPNMSNSSASFPLAAAAVMSIKTPLLVSLMVFHAQMYHKDNSYSRALPSLH